MCGIITCCGHSDCVETLMQGLRRLEYRGYDSAGIAILDANDQIAIARTQGKIAKLAGELEKRPLAGTVGIAHTRWATHGKPTSDNAHPHQYGDIAIVHNGIIENYLELKHSLQQRGHNFSSQTDSEIIAHLISQAASDAPNDEDFLHTVHRALRAVRGSYAVAVISQKHAGIVVARLHSPLVLLDTPKAKLAASDVTALLAYGKDVIYLEDGDFAYLDNDAPIAIIDHDARPVTRPTVTITWELEDAEKGGYKHYMLKEIYEQPDRIVDTLRERLLMDSGTIDIDAEMAAIDIEGFRSIQIMACGTSYYAGLIAKYIIEEVARIPVHVDFGSEYRYRNPIIQRDQLYIAISQSGETADTLSCARMIRQHDGMLLAICNVMDSTLTRLADATLYTRANIEIGVCSTKAFTTQVVSLTLLALWLAQKKRTLTDDALSAIMVALRQAPVLMAQMLVDESLRDVARTLVDVKSFLYLGRGIHYPIALEGALKLKELSYIHAEAYPSGEMKHGPIALIDENLPVVVIAPQNSAYEKTLSNLQEVYARGGRIIAIVSEGDTALSAIAEHTFTLPRTHEIIEPILSIVPLQLLAYHVADLLGCDIDQPRNLAKSVTVE